MLLNRHFFIIAFSIFFIGMIFWWQKPDAAVSAMTGYHNHESPYQIVKSYWKRMDLRQFDLAEELVAEPAMAEHDILKRELFDNPFLSIQKTSIENTEEPNTFRVRITMGSVIDNRTEQTYLVRVEQSAEGYSMTNISFFP